MLRKIKDWLIRALGGVPAGDAAMMAAKIDLLSRCPRESVSIRVEQRCFLAPGADRAEQLRRHKEAAARMLAKKLEGLGLISYEKILMPVQPSGPVSAYRLRASVWVVNHQYIPDKKDWKEEDPDEKETQA